MLVPTPKYIYRHKLVPRGSQRRISCRFVATKCTLHGAALTSWQKLVAAVAGHLSNSGADFGYQVTPVETESG